MKYKIELNDDEEVVKSIREALKENEGFCPCRIIKTEDTKCMCKNFRQQKHEGLCHCGLYRKVLVKDNEVKETK